MTMNLMNPAARAASVPTPALAFTAEPERAAEGGGRDFAGLLVERRAARAADGAQPGQRNAFDVPAAAAPVAAQPAPAPAPAPASGASPAREHEAKADAAPRADAAPASKPAERGMPARKAERGERSRSAEAAGAARSEVVAADAAAAATPPDAAAEEAASDPLEAIRAQAVIDWFARLESAAPATPAAHPVGDAATAARTLKDLAEVTAATVATTDAPGRAAPALPAATDDALPSATTALAALAPAAAGEPAFADVAAQLLHPEPAAAQPLAPLPLLAAALPTALPGAPATARSSAAASLVLDTPVTAPDFSQALATQLTTLARDGIQQATLQLNPAELGPIAVKIVLDGAQAQIDFAAEHARTREAIEAGLPTLAAALHGAGLRLSGGGVFEQRRGQGDTPDASPGARGSEASPTGETVSAVTPQRHVVRGLLDAYA